MVDVIAAVDSTTGAFGSLVQNRLRADMQTAINAGVTAAVQGMPTIAQAVSNALAPLTTTTAIAAASVNKRNISTGWFHVTDYGAKHDGTTYDNGPIQAAIDAATAAYASTLAFSTNGVTQRVYLESGGYLLTALSYTLDDGTADGTIMGILLRDGVELFGPGVLKVRSGAYGSGAFFAAVRSKPAGVSNAKLVGITVDGNRGGNTASQQCSNIVLPAKANVTIDGVRSINANGNGIMVYGTTTTVAKNISVINCAVDGCSTIGIQCSQFDGLRIVGNDVSNTSDNSIDVYGENGTTSTHAYSFVINNNRCTAGGTGIFLETVSHGVCTGNIVNSCGEGFHVNRINGAPEDLNITGNTITGCATGVACTGDTNGVTISNNYINYFNTAGVKLGGAGRVSNYYAINNVMNGVTGSVPLFLVSAGTNQATKLIHRGTITQSTDRSYDNVIYVNSGGNTFVAATAPGN